MQFIKCIREKLNKVTGSIEGSFFLKKHNFKRNTLKLLQKIKEIWNLGSNFNGMSDLRD